MNVNTKGRVIHTGPKGGRYVLSGGRKIYKFTEAPKAASPPRAASPPKNTKGRVIHTGAKGGKYVLGPSGRKIYKFTPMIAAPKSPEKIILDSLFIEFVKRVKPDFGRMYLSGGMAIKLLTGAPVPTIDFDFVYQVIDTPTSKTYTDMASRMKKILTQFVKEIPGTKLISTIKKLDDGPTLINRMVHKYKYGHAGFSVYIPSTKTTIDLVDVVLIKQPLYRIHEKNGMPLPNLKDVYLDTAFVVHKSLVSSGYDGWRNPIRSTHHNASKRPMYEEKGRKDINRLILMGGFAHLTNIHNSVQRLKRAVNTKNIASSKDIGRNLYNKIKRYRNDSSN